MHYITYCTNQNTCVSFKKNYRLQLQYVVDFFERFTVCQPILQITKTSLIGCFDILYSLHKRVQKPVMVLYMDDLYFIYWECSINKKYIFLSENIYFLG